MNLHSASKVIRSLNRWMRAEEATFLFREGRGKPWEPHRVLGGEALDAPGAPSPRLGDALPTSQSLVSAFEKKEAGAKTGAGATAGTDPIDILKKKEAFMLIPRGQRSRRVPGELGLYLRFPHEIGEEERAWIASLRETVGSLLAAEGRYTSFVNEMENFLQILTHDLKSPANAVAGFVDILFEDFGETMGTPITELLTRIRSSAARLQGILDGVYSIRRATFVPARPGSVGLEDLLRDAYLRAHDAYRGVPCEFVIPRSETLPRVTVDAEKIEMAFSAIFDNAFKFRQKSQTLRISVTYVDLGAGAHSLLIEDNSLGFESRFRDAVFEPFRKLNPPGDYPGAGVGLTVARTCIDEHHGDLRVEPSLGEGLQVYVSFRDLGN
jgi:signal transduction histidine kinase